jgi:hypothetical protein
MAVTNTTTLVCDRCGRRLVTDEQAAVRESARWLAIATQNKQILFCPDDANSFQKFIRGGAVKSVRP